jgi:hypothetical protein
MPSRLNAHLKVWSHWNEGPFAKDGARQAAG